MEPASRPLLFGIFKRTSPPVFAGSALILFGLVAFVLRDPAGARIRGPLAVESVRESPGPGRATRFTIALSRVGPHIGVQTPNWMQYP